MKNPLRINLSAHRSIACVRSVRSLFWTKQLLNMVFILGWMLVGYAPLASAQQLYYTHPTVNDGDLNPIYPGHIKTLAGEEIIANSAIGGNPVCDSQGNMYFTKRQMEPVRFTLHRRNLDGSIDDLGQIVDTSGGYVNQPVCFLAISPDDKVYYTHPHVYYDDGFSDPYTVVPPHIRQFGGEIIVSDYDVVGNPVFDSEGNMYFVNHLYYPDRFLLQKRNTNGSIIEMGQLYSGYYLTEGSIYLSISPDDKIYYTHPWSFYDDGVTPGYITHEFSHIKEFGGATIVSLTGPFDIYGIPPVIGGYPVFDFAGNMYFTKRYQNPIRHTLHRRNGDGSVDDLGQIVDTSAGCALWWDSDCYLAFPTILENVKVASGIRVVRYRLPDGSLITRKVGPDDNDSASTLQIEPRKGEGLFGLLKNWILRRRDGQAISNEEVKFKMTKWSGIGVRGKAEGNCESILYADLSESETVEDDAIFSGTGTDTLSIHAPLSEEHSGAYFTLYYSVPDQEWLRTQHVILEVAEEEDATPDQNCGTPLASIVDAYLDSVFQELTGMKGLGGKGDVLDVNKLGAEGVDLDGDWAGIPNIEDLFEIAAFHQCLYGNNIHPYESQAADAYAYNRLLLDSDDEAIVQVLRDAGAIPFVAATLAISSTWQAFWSHIGLVNEYQLVTGSGGNSEPFSPGGDLNEDGTSNQEVFDDIIAAGGTIEDYLGAVDPSFLGGDEGEGEGEGEEEGENEGEPVSLVTIIGRPRVEEGLRVVLSLSLPSLAGEISIEWYRNDALLEGETGLELWFYSIALADAGIYHVVVTDESKAVYVSPPFVLTVLPEGSLPAVGIIALIVLATILVGMTVGKNRKGRQPDVTAYR